MLRLLLCVVALDEHRNFARAAKFLGFSQPTLTRSLQELERQLGAKLFDRSKRGVEPTPFGEIVLRNARRVSLDVAEMKREIALLKGLSLGELAVGVGPIVSQTFLGSAIGALLANHPALNLRIIDLDWWDIPAALHERRIDLAVGEAPDSSDDPDIIIEPLPQRPVRFYCRADHALLRLKNPTVRDIGAYPLIGPKLPNRTSQFLAKGRAMGQMVEGGQYFEPRIHCQNLDANLHVVRASDAVGIATEAKLTPLVAKGDIAIIPFHAAWMRTNYAIIHLRGRTLAPSAAEFCSEVCAAERRYNEPAGHKRRRRP